MKKGPAFLFTLLSLSGCDQGSDPGKFVPADFYGEWQLSLPQTSCWEAMEIVFILDETGNFQYSLRSVNVDGRWGLASEAARNRLVMARLDWDEPYRFDFAFFREGESGAFAVFGGVLPDDTMTPELLKGRFFDQNRQACLTPVAAAKIKGIAP